MSAVLVATRITYWVLSVRVTLPTAMLYQASLVLRPAVEIVPLPRTVPFHALRTETVICPAVAKALLERTKPTSFTW